MINEDFEDAPLTSEELEELEIDLVKMRAIAAQSETKSPFFIELDDTLNKAILRGSGKRQAHIHKANS